MRLSRPDYDKPWRCPGWSGGGTRYAWRYHCRNGYVRPAGGEWDGSLRARWSFGRCNECDVVTWPYALRWLDPAYWPWAWQLHRPDWTRR